MGGVGVDWGGRGIVGAYGTLAFILGRRWEGGEGKGRGDGWEVGWLGGWERSGRRE